MKNTLLCLSVALLGCAPQESSTTDSNPDTPIETDWSQDSEESENDTESSNDSQDTEEPEEDRCPDSWLLTYALNGRVDITHTPLNIGNADALVGGLDTDELVLRIPDDGGKPANGQVLLTAFDLLQDFTASVNMIGEIAIVSYLQMDAVDECGLASGQFNSSTISWDQCTYGDNHGTNNWSPDDGAYGPGCISDYSVQGTVDCIDNSWIVSCEDGWLNEGQNNLSYVYNQPLLNLEFESNSLERFTMKGSQYGTELPTNTNNRIWLALEGELKSMKLEPTPDCLCGG